MQASGFTSFQFIELSYVSSPTDHSVRVKMRTDQVFTMQLWEGPSGRAVASAEYWGGRLSLYVTYSDPPGGVRPAKLRIGEFGTDGENVVSHQEDQDNLKEVQASCPEEWAKFCSRLPEILLAAEVMES